MGFEACRKESIPATGCTDHPQSRSLEIVNFGKFIYKKIITALGSPIKICNIHDIPRRYTIERISLNWCYNSPDVTFRRLLFAGSGHAEWYTTQNNPQNGAP
jgi:hypothetical protein